MKKKLEADLKDLAQRIIDKDAPDLSLLKDQARELYEKLTILSFTEANLSSFSTTEEPAKPEPKKEEKVVAEEKVVPLQAPPAFLVERDDYLPDGTEYNDSEVTEPNTEKIKDIVAQMPPETEKLDYLVSNIISKNNSASSGKAPEKEKRDFDIGVDYDNLPNFEPVKKNDRERPKSLNDRLKKGFNIGLNERLAFIRHLFDGNTADYNRVISQLSTFDSLEEAKKFIQLVVKPDYKHWQGKEEFEAKFMELVENKFGH